VVSFQGKSMFYHNVSLSMILKHGVNGNINGNMRLQENVKTDLISSIRKDFISEFTKDNQCNLIIGDSIIYGCRPQDYSVFNEFDYLTLQKISVTSLSTSSLKIEASDIASTTDGRGNSYTIFYLPVFIETVKPLAPSSVALNSLHLISNDTFSIIDNYFSLLNIKMLSLGYGFNDLLQDTLLNDFESLFNLEGLINNNEITIFVPYHFSFYKEEGVTIALFKSLISFEESFKNKQPGKSIINEYIQFTKNFRTGLSILKLLGRPYRILKASKISDSIVDEVLLENPLLKDSGIIESSEYIVEKIEGNTEKLLEVDNVEVDVFDDIQNGVIGVLVTWTKKEECILRESVYPTKFETEDFVETLTKQIKNSLPIAAGIKVKNHDINSYKNVNSVIRIEKNPNK
jgi:hypothetical protein